MRLMRVVIVHNRYSSALPSGENVMVDAEIAQLRAADVEVVPFLRSSDEIGQMPVTGKLMLPLAPIWAPGAQRDPYPPLSPFVVRTAHAHRVPVVQTVHNYRHVCAAATFLRDGAICRDCVGRRIPLPAVRHRCYRGSAAQSVVMAGTLALHRGTWRSVDRFIALTGGVADFLREYGIPDDRITIKPNAVADPGAPPDTPGSGFLCFGRLGPEKGIELLLDAWQRHPDGSLGTLRIAGDGPLRSAVESVASGRADVEYLGLLDAAGVRAAIRASAVVLTPSIWHDVLPTVILEALANGRPVLGTALGGIPYLVGAGTAAPAGWVVEPNAEALAAALPGAAASAAALSGPARARYLANFTPEIVLRELISVYEQVAATRTPT